MLAKTVNHFFPDFRQWLGALADTRDRERIVYRTGFLGWMGLMLFVLRLGARRQLRGELDSAEALENLNGLSGCRQEGIAHGDTVNHFVGHVPPAERSGVIHQTIVRLLRMRVLDDWRLLGHHLVVIDGFALEHAYSYGDWQIKGFYLLMQIAHMILQLIERGNLLGPDGAAMLGGLRTLSRRLAESLRNRLIPPEALDVAAAGRIQIRLDSS